MSTLTIRELPEHDRPRERLTRLGATALSDAELLAILLVTGLPGTNVVQLSQQLVMKHGSLSALARCSVNELCRLPGVGPAKAAQLAAAFGLAVRIDREERMRQRIDSPELVHQLLGPEMRYLPKESLRVILLDTKGHVIRIEEVSLGTINETLAHPREIFNPVISFSANSFILVHNHPSGDPAPSDSDRRLTARMNEIAKLLQVSLFDHVIIGSADNGRQPYFSFKETGLL